MNIRKLIAKGKSQNPTTAQSSGKSGKYSKGVVHMIKLDKLKLDPGQPRKHVDPDVIEGFVKTIINNGIIQPITCMQDNEMNSLVVDGSMRLQAAKKAGLKEIPCLFIDGKPGEIGLIANLTREDLTAVELAEALLKAKLLYDYTDEGLANVIGKARSTVTEILTINKLTKEILDECRGNRKAKQSALIEIAKAGSEKVMQKRYQSYKSKLAGESVKRPQGATQRRDKVKLLKSALQTMNKRLKSLAEDEDRELYVTDIKEDFISLQTTINKLLVADQN